jgi:hypothetical protein
MKRFLLRKAGNIELIVVYLAIVEVIESQKAETRW